MTTLGPYDYWAIEYAYKPLAPETRDRASSRRSPRAAATEPLLAYATDEDAHRAASIPTASQFDLGSDPLAYADDGLALVARAVATRCRQCSCKPGERYDVLRRNFDARAHRRSASGADADASKYVGGVYYAARPRRQRPRRRSTPVAADKQRAALNLLADRHALGATASASRPRSCAACRHRLSRHRRRGGTRPVHARRRLPSTSRCSRCSAAC